MPACSISPMTPNSDPTSPTGATGVLRPDQRLRRAASTANRVALVGLIVMIVFLGLFKVIGPIASILLGVIGFVLAFTCFVIALSYRSLSKKAARLIEGEDLLAVW